MGTREEHDRIGAGIQQGHMVDREREGARRQEHLSASGGEGLADLVSLASPAMRSSQALSRGIRPCKPQEWEVLSVFFPVNLRSGRSFPAFVFRSFVFIVAELPGLCCSLSACAHAHHTHTHCTHTLTSTHTDILCCLPSACLHTHTTHTHLQVCTHTYCVALPLHVYTHTTHPNTYKYTHSL